MCSRYIEEHLFTLGISIASSDTIILSRSTSLCLERNKNIIERKRARIVGYLKGSSAMQLNSYCKWCQTEKRPRYWPSYKKIGWVLLRPVEMNMVKGIVLGCIFEGDLNLF